MNGVLHWTMKSRSNMEIHNVPRISFDGLDDIYIDKEIFHVIACFLRKEDKNYVSKILETYNLCPML